MSSDTDSLEDLLTALTNEDYIDGWQKHMEPGVYEIYLLNQSTITVEVK